MIYTSTFFFLLISQSAYAIERHKFLKKSTTAVYKCEYTQAITLILSASYAEASSSSPQRKREATKSRNDEKKKKDGIPSVDVKLEDTFITPE